MKKIFGFSLLFLASVLMIVGCTITTNTTSTTYNPPSGVTSVEAGVSGATNSGNAISFDYSLINSANNVPIATLGDLGTGNLKITIRITSETTVHTGTVSTVTKVTGSSAQPITLAMTLDRSGSMSYDTNLSLEAAASAFVDLMGANDQGAIINFDERVVLDQALTSNKNLLKVAITQESVSGGMTALYDSIGAAVLTAEGGANTRKAVIAMTDGGENSSSTHTSTAELIAYANGKSVPVYTVGLGLSTGSYAEQVMQVIASGTGGVYYYAPGATDLTALYDKISSALRNYFTVSVTSPVTLVVGTQYTVTVELQSYGSITKVITFNFTAQ